MNINEKAYKYAENIFPTLKNSKNVPDDTKKLIIQCLALGYKHGYLDTISNLNT